MNPLKRYTRWLHTQWPAGTVEKLPLVGEDGSTNVPGLYVVGDLTGIPLLKFSADTGAGAVQTIRDDPAFQRARGSKADDVLDLVIVGGGVSGMAAALEARKRELSFKLLEASEPFSTIVNFPKGKPIYTYPTEMTPRGEIQFEAQVKEPLLEELRQQTLEQGIEPVRARAERIERTGDHFTIHVPRGEDLKALRVIVGIGRSGNFRKLGVPGEERDKVSNRLHDPKDYTGQDVLVVGGGDSALETAIALAQCGAKVTLSYRKPEFSRPKPENVAMIEQLAQDPTADVAVEQPSSERVTTSTGRFMKGALDKLRAESPEPGALNLMLGSQIQEVGEAEVTIKDKDGEVKTLPNQAVFSMIGREPPLDFFRRSGVKIRGEWSSKAMVGFALFLLFCTWMYLWKGEVDGFKETTGPFPKQVNTWLATGPSGLTYVPESSGTYRVEVERKDSAEATLDLAVLSGGEAPALVPEEGTSEGVERWTVEFEEGERYRLRTETEGDTALRVYQGESQVAFNDEDRTTWFGTLRVSMKSPSFYYTFAYCALVGIFGALRVRRRKTPYVAVQTSSLFLIQLFPLFLLPELLFPYLGYNGFFHSSGALAGLGADLFPSYAADWSSPEWGHTRAYWKAYGLILAWPLNVWNVFEGAPNTAWLVISFLQTFVLIPLLVLRWGKGAYCGWICSCGALAETLGDTHRHKMPHGPFWNRLNMVGQVILGAAFVLLGWRILSWSMPDSVFASTFPIVFKGTDASGAFVNPIAYKWIVDTLLAGIVGIGFYFWYSGRVWCRFACPLAALMHIYARFSSFRILSDKKKCISCNVCTSVCHQGIDIMNFANKGLPMEDPECVRCSACVQSCPTGVLEFGRIDPKTGEVKGTDLLPASPVRMREARRLPVVSRP